MKTSVWTLALITAVGLPALAQTKALKTADSSLGAPAYKTENTSSSSTSSPALEETKNPKGAGVVRPVKHPTYYEMMAPKDPKEVPWDKLKLTDSEGKTFSLDKFRGKMLLVNFFFAHCRDVCPPQTAALNTVYKKLGKFEQDSIQFVSVTIDPENDSQEELASYKKQYTTAKNWAFVRTDASTLEKLGKRFGALSGDPKKPLDHKARLFLMKDNGAFLLSYEAAPVDVERMTRDLTDATHTFIKPKNKS
jgi:cytochrome oxidase Cu insertion factor (SCO1/SenC/PrrC family)